MLMAVINGALHEGPPKPASFARNPWPPPSRWSTSSGELTRPRSGGRMCVLDIVSESNGEVCRKHPLEFERPN